MDELMRVLIPQAPILVLLVYAIKTLYLDAKQERAVMRAQLDAMITQLNALTIAINKLTDMTEKVNHG